MKDAVIKMWIISLSVVLVITLSGLAYVISITSSGEFLGDFKFVSKTEYVEGDDGQVIVELLNNQLSQISGVTCYSSVWYPDKRIFINDRLMVESPLKSDFSSQLTNLLMCAPLANTLEDIYANPTQYNMTTNGTGFATGGPFDDTGYYSLNGINQVLQTSGLNPGTGSFSVAFDMRMTGDGPVISNSNGGTGYDVRIDGATWRHQVDYSGWSHSGAAAMVTNVTDGQWHRIMYQLARDGSNKWRVWVDGNLEVDASMGTSFGNPVFSWGNLNANPHTFGYSQKYGLWSDVDISSVMYWNKLTIDQEAYELWNYGFGSTCNDLINVGFAEGPPIGTYAINFTVPESEGVYEYSSTCEVNNKNITRSSSFHVSSSFRRVIEDLDTIVTIVDMGMDEQSYPKEVKVEWMLRADELNITDASCWVEESTPGSLSQDVLKYPSLEMFLSCYSEVPNAIEYGIFSDSYPGMNSGFVYEAGRNGSFLFEIQDQTLWLDGADGFRIKLSNNLTEGVAATGGVIGVSLYDVSQGVSYFNDTITVGGGSSSDFHILDLNYDFLEANHVYNLSFWTVSGAVMVHSINASLYSEDSLSVYDVINPYGIVPLTTESDGILSGSGTIWSPVSGEFTPWMTIMGTASNVPGVYVDIDNDAQSFSARWDPHIRLQSYEGDSFNDYVMYCGNFFEGGAPGTCDYSCYTEDFDNSYKELEFIPEASFSTVCDVTYFIHNQEYVKRLTKETFLSHKGLRAYVVK